MQTNTHGKTATRAASNEKLQECLRGELSAMETYELALKSVTHVGLHNSLQEIFVSHARRVERLRERIVRSGAEPTESSGVWGAFAKGVQAGADLLGDRTAIAVLEAGEDRGLELYTKGLEDCDAGTWKLIATELLPEQQRTHELCRTLKSYVNAPS